MRELRLYSNALKRGYEQAADEADEDMPSVLAC
jgi:hypothetical protein